MSSLASDLSNQQMQIVETRNPQNHQQQQQLHQQQQQQQQQQQILATASIVSTTTASLQTQPISSVNANVINQNLDDFLMINANLDSNNDDTNISNLSGGVSNNLRTQSVVPTSNINFLISDITNTNNLQNQNNSHNNIVTTSPITSLTIPSPRKQLTTNTNNSLNINKSGGVGVTSTSTSSNLCPAEDLPVIKKRILEHKYQRLRSIKEK
jgi:hypothetical protein